MIQTSTSRIYLLPRTGTRIALVLSGPHAGYLAVPCNCPCGKWEPVRPAEPEDLARLNRLAAMATKAKWN